MSQAPSPQQRPVLLKLTPQQFEAIKNSQAKVAQLENRMLNIEATVRQSVSQMREYMTTFQAEVEAAKKGSVIPDGMKRDITQIWEAIQTITDQMEQLLE